jgi:hypothetical protein
LIRACVSSDSGTCVVQGFCCEPAALLPALAGGWAATASCGGRSGAPRRAMRMSPSRSGIVEGSKGLGAGRLRILLITACVSADSGACVVQGRARSPSSRELALACGRGCSKYGSGAAGAGTVGAYSQCQRGIPNSPCPGGRDEADPATRRRPRVSGDDAWCPVATSRGAQPATPRAHRQASAEPPRIPAPCPPPPPSGARGRRRSPRLQR